MSAPTEIAVAPGRRSATPRHLVVDALGIGLLAFVLRFGIVLVSHGGPGGMYGYDAGVYYSGADALIHGRVPYTDFVFLHPPGLMVVLAPFAALGRLTTDHAGYVVANLFFEVMGAVNAVLVWLIARRWGFERRAALVGGLFYAVWWGALNAEVGVRLEPLGSLLFLLAVLLLGRGRALAAGLALGAVCCVKIWWAAPVLVVLVWHLARRDRRRTGLSLLAGTALAGVVVAGPFAVLAGGTMWRRVVSDQLGRTFSSGTASRIQSLAGVSKAFPSAPTALRALAVLVVAVVFLAVVYVAWRQRAARLVVAVLATQAVVLMASPSFFTFYSNYLAGPLALAVAAASQPSPAMAPRPRLARLDARTGVAAALVAAVIGAGALVHSRTIVRPFPGRTFERATAGLHCVMVDSNSALILMNRLSSDLAHGCRNWVDVTGHTYFGSAKADVTRSRNRVWQRDLRDYLLSGDALLIVRAKGTYPSAATMRLIRRNPVLARGDGYVMYRVIHH